ncbi:hypothetical protein [Roseateles saccharophilus]|uniref:Outer membrane beta-barrel porin/alpha-amylase n=1 Tax=Roseateles saccharophilus TaxID=304 RepID=A0A4R3ULT3_ROSSA|nr:hypothetical protein [Roseateles saccharophilus]MDG0834698.1 hypothetical protein [Roseateles saccharophilus]TCU92646.1 hypothetical protein EV671_102119 [Roseateles saccharophilus]
MNLTGHRIAISKNLAGRVLVALTLGWSAATALAAGGPPMVTDDPETPGNGRWEINVAAVASRTTGRRELAIPDVDINYGLGDRIQLKLDLPWVRVSAPDLRARSGPGDTEVGVKWRFYDDEDSGLTISTYPQYMHALTDASVARGTASPGHEFLLPIEAAGEVAGVGLVGEVGKNFVQGQKGQWIAGVIASHPCGDNNECMFEVRGRHGEGQHATLLNLGVHHKLDDSLALLFAAGAERGTRSDERRQTLVYLGLQFTH